MKHRLLKLFFFSFLLIFSLLEAEEVTIDLNEPTYSDGIFSTSQGGVLKTENLRIQALKIRYEKECLEGKERSFVEAEGDLVILYGSHLLVGSKLKYDFITHTGILFDGLITFDPWFVGGAKILLNANGSYEIDQGYVTTCESDESEFILRSPKICVQPNEMISIRGVNLQFFKLPLFWLPEFKTSLKRLNDIPIQFHASTSSFHGGQAGFRYRFFSTDEWKVYLRGDYFFKRGPAGGFDTEYHATDCKRSLCTHSYVASDDSFEYPQERLRYRFAGVFSDRSPNEKTNISLVYDFLSDSEMASDYTPKDFDLDTGKWTRLNIVHKEQNWIGGLSARVRVNRFQTINQQLPMIEVSWRPQEICRTGIISDSRLWAGYLNYSYAQATPDVTDFEAARVEWKQKFYKPLLFNSIVITPEVDFDTVFYGNTPQRSEALLLSSRIGVEAKTYLHRDVGNQRHLIEPYINYQYFTAPSLPFDQHFLFDIADGFAQLSLLRFGARQSLFSIFPVCPIRWLTLDVWANAFFDSHTVFPSIPKIYSSLTWKISPTLLAQVEAGWNRTQNRMDHTNVSLAWTINEDMALRCDYLHRCAFDFRKADKDNFILDAYVNEFVLEKTPLSDRRDTLLTHLFFRLSPSWNLGIQSRFGWNRRDEPSYHEYRVDLQTFLACNWNVKFTYEHRESDDRFSLNFQLGRHLPCGFGF